jgi:hypothetical protein
MDRKKARQITSLKKITNLKEALLRAELAALSKQIRNTEEQISQLSTYPSNQGLVSESAALTKWLEWRRCELRRLNSEHAKLRLKYDQLAQIVGRAVAENEVVGRLMSDFRHHAKQEIRKSLEEDYLHFLSNNVSDQDV